MTLGGVTTSFLLDRQNVVQETQNGSPVATYLVGPRGMEYRQDASGQRRWYIYDGLGSVIAEVDQDGKVNPDQQGNETPLRKYDVYGAIRNSQEVAPGTSNHKFVGSLGHTTEAPTGGLIYMRARYYDPAIGRFSSQSFKDVLGGMLEGMKFWNKQDPFEQAQSFVGDALLALGAAKGISAAGAKLGGVKLYRAVKEAELADIKATGAFRNPYGIEKKYFSTTLEGAKEYARLAYGRWPHEGPYTIVRTRAPRGIIEWSGRIEKDIPTVVIPTKGLPQLGRPRISRRMPF